MSELPEKILLCRSEIDGQVGFEEYNSYLRKYSKYKLYTYPHNAILIRRTLPKLSYTSFESYTSPHFILKSHYPLWQPLSGQTNVVPSGMPNNSASSK